MKNSIKIVTLIFIFFSVNCKAQQDSLKYKVVNYLIEKGELDRINNSEDYFDNIFIVNLINQKKNEHNVNYSYRIGTYSSHSLFYLMLKDGNKITFLDVNKLNETLIFTINFLKEKKSTPKEILENVEEILIMYKRNMNAIPWVN